MVSKSKVLFFAVVLVIPLFVLFSQNGMLFKSGSFAQRQTLEQSAKPEFKSVIQPIQLVDDAQAESAEVNEGAREGNRRNGGPASDLFDQAVNQQQTGNLDAAEQGYRALLSDYPKMLEAYYNLATVLTEQGDLDAARATLEAGLTANAPTDRLSEALREIYRAQAAQAYSQALGNDRAPINAPSFVPITQLISDPAASGDVMVLEARFENELAQLQAKLDLATAQLNAKQVQIERLQAQLGSN